MSRYIYIRIENSNFSGCAYPYYVQAFDTKEKIGFSPQDWNYSWIPTTEYELVDIEKFAEVVKKEMKGRSTNFNIFCLNNYKLFLK